MLPAFEIMAGKSDDTLSIFSSVIFSACALTDSGKKKQYLREWVKGAM